MQLDARTGKTYERGKREVEITLQEKGKSCRVSRMNNAISLTLRIHLKLDYFYYVPMLSETSFLPLFNEAG